MLALPRPVEPSLDLISAKVHELAPGIHYWKEEEGASPRAFLSQASIRFHCTVNLGDQSRIPSRSLPIYPGVLIELTTLAQLLLISSSYSCTNPKSRDSRLELDNSRLTLDEKCLIRDEN